MRPCNQFEVAAFCLGDEDDKPISHSAQNCHQEPTLLGGDCLRVRFPEGLEIFLQHHTQSAKRVKLVFLLNLKYSPDPAHNFAALREECLSG
jgi:hypothetical protein